MFSNQLSDYKTYDTDNLILQPTDKKTEVRRIRLMTHNMDGTRGDLIFSTPRLLSFGLQKILDADQNLIGFQVPLVLWGRSGPSPDETAFLNNINNITDTSKSFLLEHKDKFDRPTMCEEDLIRLSPLYYKSDTSDGKNAPLLYVRLNTFNVEETLHIRSLFIDENSKQSIDPNLLINKRCVIQAAIRFESIIIGTKIRFQLKLLEARVRLLERGFKSLLEPGKVFVPYRNNTTTTTKPNVFENNSVETETSS